jgi:hypothetical protein
MSLENLDWSHFEKIILHYQALLESEKYHEEPSTIPIHASRPLITSGSRYTFLSSDQSDRERSGAYNELNQAVENPPDDDSDCKEPDAKRFKKA